MFINKSNTLIQNISYNLDTIELKVLSKITSLINSEAKDFQYYYEFELNDFKEELYLHNTNYSQLKDAVKKLRDKGFEILKNGGETEVYTSWLSSVITERGNGQIKVEIPREMKKYYLELHGNYTSYLANHIYKLKSKYSIRFYELLSSHKNQVNKKDYVEIKYTLKKLKTILGVSDKYEDYRNFRKWVLETAERELKEKDTDVQFKFKALGRGINKSIVFYIIDVKKQKRIAKTKQKELENKDLNGSIEKNLNNMGFNKNERTELINKYDIERLTRNISYSLKQQQANKIKTHIKAFLRKSLIIDYAMNAKKQQVKNEPQNAIKEITEFETQKEILKNNQEIQDKFLEFLSIISKNKPGGRAEQLLDITMNFDIAVAITDEFLANGLIKKFFIDQAQQENNNEKNNINNEY